MFIDFANIQVVSGNGGKGCSSFRREKFIAKGGPDGGDGGHGGSVYFCGDTGLNTLINFRGKKLYSAKNGSSGEGKNKFGKKGEDLIIKVPLGTQIFNKITKEKIFDITHENKAVKVATGGIGGKGNSRFKTSVNRAPRYAQPGLPGQSFELLLELSLIADVGLVGFPNAGKSTLLSVLSSATPKIADYAFTTLEPHLGVVKVSSFQSFVMADIPGIIEGASSGKGLGYKFLKHIRRTKILLFLLDISSQNLYQEYLILKKELHQFDIYLDKKPHLIVFSKQDLITEKSLKELENFSSVPTMNISSVTGENIKKLVHKLFEMVEDEKNNTLD